ncbi:MAG: universal stress protein [Mucilaginibacter sp.]
MKTLLVLTDFSDNATTAAKSAVKLGQMLHANILLFNNYVSIPVTPYVFGGGVVAEEANWMIDESREKLHKMAKTLETEIFADGTRPFNPAVHYENTEGNLGENVAELINSNQIEMVVMGAKTGGVVDHILTGSDTVSVIEHTTRPVLVIPPGVSIEHLQNVVFATDFSKEDMKAVKYLVKLGKQLDFKLKVIHVCLLGEKHLISSEEETNFRKQLADIDFPITYEEVRGEDVVERLNVLCTDTGTDVMALMHYQHSFFARLILSSTTKKALYHQKVPLLVIPSKMESL